MVPLNLRNLRRREPTVTTDQSLMVSIVRAARVIVTDVCHGSLVLLDHVWILSPESIELILQRRLRHLQVLGLGQRAVILGRQVLQRRGMSVLVCYDE